MNYIISFGINILWVKLSNSCFNELISLLTSRYVHWTAIRWVRLDTQFTTKKLFEGINTGIRLYATTMLWCIVFAMNAQLMSCRACLLLPYLRLLLIYQFTYCLASQPFIKALIFKASLGRIRSLIIRGFHHFHCLNFKFSLFLILITLRPKRKQKWVTFSLSCIVKRNYIVTLASNVLTFKNRPKIGAPTKIVQKSFWSPKSFKNRPSINPAWVTFSSSCIVKLNYIVTLNCFYFLISMFGLWLYIFFRNLQ